MKKFTEWLLFREGFTSETLFNEMAVQSPTAQSKIKNAFDFVSKHNLGCVLVGGMAVAHHAARAITPDVDFLCPNIAAVQQALEQEGLSHSPLVLPRELESGGLQCPELDADFLDANTGDVALNRYALGHAEDAMIGGVHVPVIEAGVLAIMKFINGREKDLDDGFKLLKVADADSLKAHLTALKRSFRGSDIDARTIWEYKKSLG